jgi:cytochrome c5
MKRCVLIITCILILGCGRQKTVWDGVYTAAQATRGSNIYDSYCVECHTADLALGPKGDLFTVHWREDNLQALFDEMKTSMPAKRR